MSEKIVAFPTVAKSIEEWDAIFIEQAVMANSGGRFKNGVGPSIREEYLTEYSIEYLADMIADEVLEMTRRTRTSKALNLAIVKVITAYLEMDR